ncbi:hypothetical protein [Dethiosulfovibrio faecalis]|uniref:hypothetical protein n=1 Tax=Dethiosulfovibrio faecalis TaxID=2720018 RepID=UPI001F1FBFB6|nr:hypothetical protein [Dethiosulfovibrio faecalis]
MGRILGTGSESVYVPGGPYWALPSPIDDKIVVTTNLQRLSLENSFWCDRLGGDGLVPGKDGFLITGDHNIVHGSWELVFQVSVEGDNPIRFLKSIGDMDRAKRLLSFMTEGALVCGIGSTSIDDFTRGNIDEKAILSLIRGRLKSLDCGIEVVDLSRSSQPQVPFQVVDDFLAVNEAESAKLKSIEDARRDRESLLQATAGTVFNELIEAIDRYEKKDSADSFLTGEKLETIYGLLDGERIGGNASIVINEAKLYKTEVVEEFRGRSERFEKLISSWKNDGAVVEDRLLWRTWEKILSGTVNSYYLPPGKKRIYLHLQDSLNGL